MRRHSFHTRQGSTQPHVSPLRDGFCAAAWLEITKKYCIVRSLELMVSLQGERQSSKGRTDQCDFKLWPDGDGVRKSWKGHKDLMDTGVRYTTLPRRQLRKLRNEDCWRIIARSSLNRTHGMKWNMMNLIAGCQRAVWQSVQPCPMTCGKGDDNLRHGGLRWIKILKWNSARLFIFITVRRLNLNVGWVTAEELEWQWVRKTGFRRLLISMGFGNLALFCSISINQKSLRRWVCR